LEKVALTAARIARHECEPEKSQSFLWDAKTPGLGLRATPGGKKSFVFQGKLNGDTVRIPIGDPKTWTIAAAQEVARSYRVAIDKGIDPRVEKIERRAATAAKEAETRRQDVTFGTAWDAYLASRKTRWSERHYRDHLQHASEGGRSRKRGDGKTVAGPLASFRACKLPELTGQRVALWLDAESFARPTMAALSYRLLRAFIRWTADVPAYKNSIPADAYTARSVKDAVPKVRAKEGDCLQREHLADWFYAVRKISNPVISIYLQALLITGARREEMAALKWSDVEFKYGGALILSDKIEDHGRTIPLTPYLAALLTELKKRNDTPPNVVELSRMQIPGEKWEPSPWVFSSKSAADGKIAEPRLRHNQALAEAGLPHITLHGLRRSFGTLAEWVECPVGVVAQIQGHKPSAIAEKHYRRRSVDLLRLWHVKIEAWMLQEAGLDELPLATAPLLQAVHT
jgi:integrase